ncbi:MAG TPA: hypothetical protein VHF58_06620 [Solirubrobacterales bacterium]|nr:hypothetical protein [Solirubrobacterales bacterium]
MALAAGLTLAACGEKDEPDLGSLPPAPTATTTPEEPGTTTEPEQPPAGGGETGDGAGDSLTREAEHAIQAYITWIDRGQGGRLCKLIDEDALENLRLPVRRGGCGTALSASIGYRDPRGLPVFDGVRLRELAVRVRGRSARGIATVSVTFADRGAPSVEDDVIYLERRAGNWIVAKPSATLYRAIGAELPASAISPPR